MLVQTNGNERMFFTHKGSPNHILILEVNADADEYQNKLTEAGIHTSSIKDAGGCGKSLDVYDPDGNLIKLWFGYPRQTQ